MQRYRQRGNNEQWLEKIQDNFEYYIQEYEKRKAPKIVLRSDETLEDYFIRHQYTLVKK